jgi:molecular chaperone GrpE (heat shock protein)
VCLCILKQAVTSSQRRVLIFGLLLLLQVVRIVARFAGDTPLDSGKSTSSYIKVYEALTKTDISFEDKWEEKVLNYVVEWEKLMTIKFTHELKKVEELRKSLDHYEKKMQNLRSSSEKEKAKQNKGASVNSTEKMERNEDKLEQARRDYGKNEENLRKLFEEFVDRSWKDLYPLLVSLSNFDLHFNKGKAALLEDLQNVLEDLSEVAKKHGVSRESKSASGLWRSFPTEWRENT